MAVFETITLLSFWVHYTGDIVAGVIIGHWVYDIGGMLKGPVDKLLFLDWPSEEDQYPLI